MLETMNENRELTRAELEIMQIIWAKKKVLIHDILEDIAPPKPAYNTVSTIVRILEKKGFVSHKAYGKTYEYFPIVEKEDYTRTYMKNVLNNFFDGSFSSLVSFFAEDKSISANDIDEIMKMINNSKK